MQLTDSHSRMPATSTEDLQSNRGCIWEKNRGPRGWRCSTGSWLRRSSSYIYNSEPCTCRRPHRSSKEYLRRNIQSPCTYTQGLQCRYNIRWSTWSTGIWGCYPGEHKGPLHWGPWNPNSEVSDIETIAKIAHAHKIPLVIDSTFATPYLVRPIEYGADIVVHSATKFIGGHGTTIGGVIIDSGNFDWKASGKFPQLTEPNESYHGVSFVDAAGPAAFVTRIRAILLRDTGATISPIHSWIFLQGLETLSLRVERHVSNALKVVEYLNNHPLVEKVNHPSVSTDPEQQRLYKKYFPNGGGSIFTFEIKGDAETAKKFIDNLEIFSLLANVADVKSLAIHPASTTHSELNEAELIDQGIKQNTIRLSIGTENIDDIIEDLDEAFKAIQE